MLALAVDRISFCRYMPPQLGRALKRHAFECQSYRGNPATSRISTMKIKNSLKALKARHRENRLVRRKGRVELINKLNPRYKARQG